MLIICRGAVVGSADDMPRAFQHGILHRQLAAKVGLGAALAQLRDVLAVQRGGHVLGLQALGHPPGQQVIHAGQALAVGQQVAGQLGQRSLGVQRILHSGGHCVIGIAVVDIVHHAVHKGQHTAGLGGGKRLPCVRDDLHAVGKACHKQADFQLVHIRRGHGKAQLCLTVLPEHLIQLVLCQLVQLGVAVRGVGQQDFPQCVLKLRGAALADGAEQRCLHGIHRVRCQLVITEPLLAGLLADDLGVFLQDGLALGPNAQIGAQQRDRVGVELLGVQNRILQVVLLHGGLGERCIDQVIALRVLAFQQNLGSELVGRRQMPDFCILQRHSVHIIGKIAVVIVPEHQPAPLGRKLGVQLIHDLVVFQFRHRFFLLLCVFSGADLSFLAALVNIFPRLIVNVRVVVAKHGIDP